jgi:SAM-dependent methyltransferase
VSSGLYVRLQAWLASFSRAEPHLADAFGHANPDHYAWRTETPLVSDRERELVQAAFSPLGARVLDVGCGEGATFLHLGGPSGVVGIDVFEAKVAFARERLPLCTFVSGSAYELPFEDGAFDHVIVRDVVHHLDHPDRALREIARVLEPGGRLDLLEPSRNNPLVFLHALTTPSERGELRSSPTTLRAMVDSHFDVQAVDQFQALPIHRVAFHPTLGSPRLASSEGVRRWVDSAEKTFDRVFPRVVFAYVRIRATRRAR